MKQLLIYVILILLSFTSCQKQKNEVIVKGKFIGEIPKELIYSVPLNGICYEFFNSSTEVDSLGNFKFHISTETPCFIMLFLKGNRGHLIAEPGESYYITIESNDTENLLNFECKNIKLQEEYQKLDSPWHPQLGIASEIRNSSISDVENRTDSMLNAEMENLENLWKKEALSKELFEIIKLDRTLYYSCVQGQLAMIRFYDVASKNPDAKTDSIKQMWRDATSRVSLNSKDLLKSKWAYYYLQNYLMFKEYTAEYFSFDTRSKARDLGNIHTHLINISNKNLTGSILEFYNSAYILSMTRQEKYEKELITLFEEFKNEFPISNYTKFIEPQIEKVIDFHKNAELEFDNDSKFLDNYQNLKTLEECLKSFKGKKVYIDIWATWCGYCKDEFTFNNKLQNLLNSKNIEILYISTDRDNEDKQWKDMIKYYDLKGFHVRASKELKSNLEVLFGSFGIPRYLLIDEKGKIVSNNAKRPSELKELEKQINEK
jgi:thiol-disulfide isomerase/thioredoxin